MHTGCIRPGPNIFNNMSNWLSVWALKISSKDTTLTCHQWAFDTVVNILHYFDMQNFGVKFEWHTVLPIQNPIFCQNSSYFNSFCSQFDIFLQTYGNLYSSLSCFCWLWIIAHQFYYYYTLNLYFIADGLSRTSQLKSLKRQEQVWSAGLFKRFLCHSCNKTLEKYSSYTSL